MNIYTGRGDFGNTNIIGGGTVKKSDSLVHAYGEVDELNSSIGLLLAFINRDKIQKLHYYDENEKAGISTVVKELKEIQSDLFDVGSILSDPKSKMGITVQTSRIKFLENGIDRYQSNMEPLKYFVLPSGSVCASQAHVVRTVVRRAERSILKAYDEDWRSADPAMLVYMNRLSDYFFALSRFLNKIDDYEDSYYKKTGEVFH